MRHILLPFVSAVALKVILDANMLMNIAQKRIDIFREIENILVGKVEFIILKPVLDELRGLTSTRSKTGKEASMTLKMIRRYQISEPEARDGESVDSLMLRFTDENRGILATGDAELIRRARNANIPLIYLKGRSRLALEGLEPAYR